MPLRATAPVFIPGAAKGHATSPLEKGDQLIQDLASAMLPPGLEPPCWSRKIMPEEFPVAGIFCPYCIAGGACAFHKSAAPAPAKHAYSNAEGYKFHAPPGLELLAQNTRLKSTVGGISQKVLAFPDSALLPNTAHTATSYLGFVEECVLDSVSETQDSEGASTDVGASEAWCGASDTSDPPPTVLTYSDIGVSFPWREPQNDMLSELRAYGKRYDAAAHPSVLRRGAEGNLMVGAR